MSRKPNEQLARTILDGPQGQLIRTLVLQEQSPVSDAELAELIKQLKDYGDTLQKIGERNVSSHYQDVARAGQQRLDWAAMVKKAADILAAQDCAILAVRGRAAVLQGQLDGANAKIEQMNAIDREAADCVESVICMRSAHFTGEDPYVGWKGLGLALTQDYDDLATKDAALREISAEAGVTTSDMATEIRSKQRIIDLVNAALAPAGKEAPSAAPKPASEMSDQELQDQLSDQILAENGPIIKCPKCGCESGDNWSQCEGSCLMPGSPHYKTD